jgi:hypothetical protein
MDAQQMNSRQHAAITLDGPDLLIYFHTLRARSCAPQGLAFPRSAYAPTAVVVLMPLSLVLQRVLPKVSPQG